MCCEKPNFQKCLTVQLQNVDRGLDGRNSQSSFEENWFWVLEKIILLVFSKLNLWSFWWKKSNPSLFSATFYKQITNNWDFDRKNSADCFEGKRFWIQKHLTSNNTFCFFCLVRIPIKATKNLHLGVKFFTNWKLLIYTLMEKIQSIWKRYEFEYRDLSVLATFVSLSSHPDSETKIETIIFLFSSFLQVESCCQRTSKEEKSR